VWPQRHTEVGNEGEGVPRPSTEYVWDTPICHEETERGSRQPTNPRADIPKDTAPRSVISRVEGSMITHLSGT
jgi:hypothetical protein